jgi:DNA-directed RNA polymerase sigma subunit (sigma70/sigma32)
VSVKETHRNHMMVAKFLAGRTLQEIGDWAGVSRQRVQQILQSHGMSRERRAELRKKSRAEFVGEFSSMWVDLK